MLLTTVGLNHKTAPIAIREKVSFLHDTLKPELCDLIQLPGISEAYILSTCNRTEVYSNSQSIETVMHWLAKSRQLAWTDLSPHTYVKYGTDAIRHLLRVASGLDSMAVGETQIFGQMKSAYQVALTADSLGQQLRGLLERVFSAGKKIRTEAEIQAHPISLAYSAARLVKQIFSDLADKKILLLGAGQTIELVAKHLESLGACQFVVASRTADHALYLAKQFDGYVLQLSQLETHIHEADIVISALSKREPLLVKEQLQKALAKRKRRMMCMIDLGVPRNIASDVSELADVYLYNVDDLQSVVDEGLKARENAAKKAELLVEHEVLSYERWSNGLQAKSTIRLFREVIQDTLSEEIKRAQKQLELGHDPQEVMAAFAKRFGAKLSHQPTKNIRKASINQQSDLLKAVHHLFSLEEDLR